MLARVTERRSSSRRSRSPTEILMGLTHRGGVRRRADRRAEVIDATSAFKDSLVSWATTTRAVPRVDYRPRSYIGLRYGRRVWAPMLPQRDGAYIYLPDPSGSRDKPSFALEDFERRLQGSTGVHSWPTVSPSTSAATPYAIPLREPGHVALSSAVSPVNEPRTASF